MYTVAAEHEVVFHTVHASVWQHSVKRGLAQVKVVDKCLVVGLNIGESLKLSGEYLLSVVTSHKVLLSFLVGEGVIMYSAIWGVNTNTGIWHRLLLNFLHDV